MWTNGEYVQATTKPILSGGFVMVYLCCHVHQIRQLQSSSFSILQEIQQTSYSGSKQDMIRYSKDTNSLRLTPISESVFCCLHPPQELFVMYKLQTTSSTVTAKCFGDTRFVICLFTTALYNLQQ